MLDRINAVSRPGIYVSRAGRLVFITSVEEGGDALEKPCTGYIVTGTSAQIVNVWGRWFATGAYADDGTHDNDIVARL